MWQDLTEEPLPTDDDLDQMFKEIKDLEHASDNEEGEDDEDVAAQQQDRLQSILSSIPSFSQMNKKKDEITLSEAKHVHNLEKKLQDEFKSHHICEGIELKEREKK